MQSERAIRIANGEAELASIFRFRYRVFVEFLSRRDLDGVDHDAKLLTDALDGTSTHFYAGMPGRPVAALTVSPAASTEIPAYLRHFLDIDRLAEAAPLKNVVFVNWLLVDPAESGSVLVTALMAAAVERALQEGVALVVTFCRPGLVSFYERLGFEQYRHAEDVKGIGLRCPLLLVLQDGARLKAIRSPLSRLLRTAVLPEGPGSVRLRLEPLIDLFQASQILVKDDLWLETDTVFVERSRPRLFDGLPEQSVRQIMKLASVISCRAGQVVARTGETSDDMFLVAQGSFAAHREPAGAERALGEGDLFGEVEHFSGLPRIETVTCVSGGHVAAFKAASLFQWIRQNPEPGATFAINLARLIAMRVAEGNESTKTDNSAC